LAERKYADTHGGYLSSVRPSSREGLA
jgi:hypothetical protein